MIELAVFDIAGTTIEEHQAVYVALADAVRAAGAEPTSDDIASWMGADKREAIGALTGLTDVAEIEDVHTRFRTRLAELYAETPPQPLPGVTEALAQLRTAGIKVALTTGFDHAVADDLLATVGWGDNLDAVVCADDVEAGRPAPFMIQRAMALTGIADPAHVLTAGDTTRDLYAGTNAGAAIVVGVLSGGQSRELLESAPHTHLLGSVAEIAGLLADRGQSFS
ncbi:MAG TPA: phosphonatase-like hydrolase [Jatrophihabitans sp.]